MGQSRQPSRQPLQHADPRCFFDPLPVSAVPWRARRSKIWIERRKKRAPEGARSTHLLRLAYAKLERVLEADVEGLVVTSGPP